MCQILSGSEQSLVSFVTVISSKVQNQLLSGFTDYVNGSIHNVFILKWIILQWDCPCYESTETLPEITIIPL